MQNFIAFTKNEKSIVKTLKTKVSVIIDKKLNPQYVKTTENYIAIWDTGATNTVISETLAKKLNLTINGIATINTAGGTILANQYILGLKLPNNLEVKNIIVTAGTLAGDADFLIGMDIISLGDFSLTNVNNKTTFTFRYPSCETIDYVKQGKMLHKKELTKKLQNLELQIKKGGKCHCGSGKKYRYCHGKNEIKIIKEELAKLETNN